MACPLHVAEDIMLKGDQLPFKVGQYAEAQSFENGFRGAWFRCKIKKINCRRGHWNALLEYFDYPDEKLTWTKLYQYPPYNVGKSKEKKQLMLRPQYPLVKLKNEISDVSSISEATVVVDGDWQAGDSVDWWANGCYWSGQLTKLLGNSEAELALTPPPVGEGALYEVSFKDLRPSLEWSSDFGWTVPTSQDGDNVRQCAQLIQPVNQAFGRFPALEIHSMSEGRTGSSSDLSFSTPPSINLSTALEEKRDLNTTESAERPPLFDLPKEATVNTSKKVRRPDICSSSHTGDILAKESILSDKASSSCVGVDLAKADAGPTSYSSCPLKKFRTNDGIQLHSMNSDLMEAAILDLEELVNKIKWLKGLLESRTPMSGDARPSWKFVEHHFPSGNK